MHASLSGHDEVVHKLLQYNAQVDLQDSVSCSPFILDYR